MSFGRSGQLQLLRNDSAPEKKPWEKYLLPNPHTERLKFYNNVVPQIYESSFVSKQAGFKQYLLEQQQMRCQLNTKIKALSDKENNLLRNENWGVCQNITKFMSGVDGCKGSGDVAKCESSLTTVNEAFNSASDLLSFMNNRRKNLYTEERTLRSFASDELKYFQEAQERVKAIHQELQKASNALTTTLMSLKRKFPSPMGNNGQSRRKKENKRKVKKIKEKRLHQRAALLLEKLTSKEVAKEVFDSLEKNTYKCVSSINAGFTARFVKRLHLDPLLWLLERGVFETELARNLKVVVARMNEENSSNGAEKGSSSGEDSDESDEETVQEPVERAAEDSDTEAEQDTASPK